MLPYLQPSDYDVEVTANGFHKMKKENVTLLVAQKLDLDFKLEVGQMNQEITVQAEVEVLQTADASGGMNFDSTMTSEYALNGRQLYMMMDLSPGVLFTQEEFGATGYSGTRGWDVNGNFTMNGSKTGTTAFALNGSPISLTGTFNISPNVDAVQEFKVMTNTWDAAIGRSGGGAVNTSIKAGTNSFHFTAGEFIRNRVFDANTTQLNAAGQPRGKHNVNQISLTAGGPIRKNKDFIFGSIEIWRERVPFSVVADVPTHGPAQRTAASAPCPPTFSIRSPATPASPRPTASAPATAPTSAIPSPATSSPRARMSPIGRKILSYFPAPNYPGARSTTTSPTPAASTATISRSCAGITSSTITIASTSSPPTSGDRNSAIPPEFRARALPAISGPAASRSPSAPTSRTSRTPTSSTCARPSAASARPSPMSTRPTSTDRPGSRHHRRHARRQQPLQQPAPRHARPVFEPVRQRLQPPDLQGGEPVEPRSQRHASQGQPDPTSSAWTWSTPAWPAGDTGYANGFLNFNRWGSWQYSSRTSALNAADGNSIADILLGIPYSGQVDAYDSFYRTWPYFGVFVQTDWKVRRNLTLNLGLRYDVQIPWVERFDRNNAGFDFNAVSPYSDAVIAQWKAYKAEYDATNPKYPYPDVPAAILGGKTFVDPNEEPPHLRHGLDRHSTAHRLAWALAPRTVLRTGFGMYHRTATQTGLTDGFNQTTTFNRSLDGDRFPSSYPNGVFS